MDQRRYRPLGPIALLALGINGIVGVGIFFIPSTVSSYIPGVWGASVYALTTLFCIPIALCFSRLGPIFDEDGGPYVFARAAFGPDAAFMVGWLTFSSAVLSTSAVIRGLSEAICTSYLTADAQRMVATATVLVLSAIVFGGLRITAWAWTTMTVAKLAPLLALLIVWMAAPVAHHATFSLSDANVQPSTLLRSGLIVLFSLQGFEIIAVPASSVRSRPFMATATILSLSFAGVLYFGLHLACVQAIPELHASKAPLVEAARALGGPCLAGTVMVGTSISALGIALGMIAMSPRYLSALGRSDGLGTWFGVTNERGVPRRALILTSCLVLLFVQVGRLEQLFAMSSIAVLAQYGSTSASLLWMGAKGQWGLGRKDLVVGVVALAASLVVLTGATWQETFRAVALLALGWLIKFAVSMGRRKP